MFSGFKNFIHLICCECILKKIFHKKIIIIARFGLKKITKPWHNLYLDDTKIKKTKFKGLQLVNINELFSTYYFTSRVLNAAINQKPKYNDSLNLNGWKLSQNLIKGFSQLRLYEFKFKN